MLVQQPTSNISGRKHRKDRRYLSWRRGMNQHLWQHKTRKQSQPVRDCYQSHHCLQVAVLNSPLRQILAPKPLLVPHLMQPWYQIHELCPYRWSMQATEHLLRKQCCKYLLGQPLVVAAASHSPILPFYVTLLILCKVRRAHKKHTKRKQLAK